MTTLSEEQQNYLQLLVIVIDVALPTLKSFFERIYAQIGNSKEKFNALISQFHKQYNENASFPYVSDEVWKQER
jgi:DNA-directed RNA polymerase delta subunit